MKKADIQTIKERIKTSGNNSFLYLGGHHFPQDLLDNAETIAKKIDSSISCFWVWKDTEFDDPDATLGQEPYRQGPVLIQINNISEKNSALIDHFINVWANEQKGLLLSSTFTGEELNAHLQSLLWMQGENNEAEHYSVNLQNPNLQSVWLQSFDTKQLQAFMGPIHTISWLEFCGYDMQWYIQTNEKPEFHLQNIGWCHFDNAQISQFERLEHDFLHRELTSHILYQQPKIETSLAKQKALDTMKQAKDKGITDVKSILLALKAQLFIKNKDDSETVIALLANQEMPLDMRIQLSERKVNQAQQAQA